MNGKYYATHLVPSLRANQFWVFGTHMVGNTWHFAFSLTSGGCNLSAATHVATTKAQCV